MARTTTTTYSCDYCKKEVGRKELYRFRVSSSKLSGYDSFYASSFDLCEKCEAAFIDGLVDVISDEDRQSLGRR